MWRLVGKKYHILGRRPAFYSFTARVTICNLLTSEDAISAWREQPRIKDRCKKCEKIRKKRSMG